MLSLLSSPALAISLSSPRLSLLERRGEERKRAITAEEERREKAARREERER